MFTCLLVFLLVSCDKESNGIAIEKPGIYECLDGKYAINVSRRNDLIGYCIKDAEGNVLVENGDIKFGALYPWAFYFSAETKSLWVFSSDLGHFVWKFDEVKNQYRCIQIDHRLRRNEVPVYIYDALPEFFK